MTTDSSSNDRMVLDVQAVQAVQAVHLEESAKEN